MSDSIGWSWMADGYFETSDPDIATVTQDGLITGVSPGTCLVRAPNGEVITITVVAPEALDTAEEDSNIVSVSSGSAHLRSDRKIDVVRNATPAPAHALPLLGRGAS